MDLFRLLLISLVATLCTSAHARRPRPVRKDGLVGCSAQPRGLKYPWLGKRAGSLRRPLCRRFPPPAGYRRPKLPRRSFGAWLRHLPLLAKGTPVRLYNGRLKWRQDVHLAVVDLDVGRRNLQQCADAIMRLRAEWLLAAGLGAGIGFNSSSGGRFSWLRWRAGYRPRLVKKRWRWRRTAKPNRSRRAFKRFMTLVFAYAGTASLARELKRVSQAAVVPGVLLIQGGYPGHAVLVLDTAIDSKGRKLMLVGQSFMPAQQFHVLKGRMGSPRAWTPVAKGRIVTPEWSFTDRDFKRFPPVKAEATRGRERGSQKGKRRKRRRKRRG